MQRKASELDLVGPHCFRQVASRCRSKGSKTSSSCKGLPQLSPSSCVALPQLSPTKAGELVVQEPLELAPQRRRRRKPSTSAMSSLPSLQRVPESSPSRTRSKSSKCLQRVEPLQSLGFVIQMGNNHWLLRDLLRRRPGWKPGLGDPANVRGLKKVDDPDDTPHMSLLWTAWRSGDFLDAVAGGEGAAVSANTCRELRLMPAPLPAGGLRAHNHFDGNAVLCRKYELRETMVSFYEAHGRDAYGVIPLSFVIKEGSAEPEFQKFRDAFKRAEQERLWLVKPGAHSNQGRGILVHDSIEAVQEHVDSKMAVWVIQKYISRPLLMDGRKFDIRMYGLVTQEPNSGAFHAYFFNDGYVRTTSSPFSLNSLDRAVHITNDQVQREDECYGKFEEGNKLSLEDLRQYLSKARRPPGTFQNIVSQMRAIVADAVQAAAARLNPRNIDNCFELFGFDFMLDDDCRVWLLEVNTDPSLEIHSEHQKKLIPVVVDGVLQLTIDKIFGAPALGGKPASSDGPVQAPCLKWEHVFCSDHKSGSQGVACHWLSKLTELQ